MGVISISFFIFFTKAYKSEVLIDSQIYQKNHHSALSDRITKFHILKKKKNLEYVIMGTSSTWVFDPKLIEKKYNLFGKKFLIDYLMQSKMQKRLLKCQQ